MTSTIEDEARGMLRSIDITIKKDTPDGIIKLVIPSSKIVELAEKLDIGLIMMGNTGIGF
jgi:hypothetical protein